MTRPELDGVYCKIWQDLVQLAKRRLRVDLAEEVVQEAYLLIVQNEVYKKWPRSRIEAQRRIGYKVRTQISRKHRTESKYVYEGGHHGRAGTERDPGLDGCAPDGGTEQSE